MSDIDEFQERQDREVREYLLAEAIEASPKNGTPFHRLEDASFFENVDTDTYRASDQSRDRAAKSTLITTIFGVAGAGKDTAIVEALNIAILPKFRHVLPEISRVTAGTTRHAEIRGKRFEEDEVDYDFYNTFIRNILLREMYERGDFVQIAKPRTDGHLYFTEPHNYPEGGVALLDTVPKSFDHIDQLMEGTNTMVLAMYRAFTNLDVLRRQRISRGDLLNTDGTPVNQAAFNAREQEGVDSTYHAYLNRHRFAVFETEDKLLAGEAVIAIVTGNHTEAMQRRGVAALVRGLNDYKKLGLTPTILKDKGEEFTEDV